RALEPEQATRLIVHERDTAIPVRGHHPFADAVKHRLALLEQRGDVARLETERLPLEAPREQKRARVPRPSARATFPAITGIHPRSVAFTWSWRKPTETMPMTRCCASK